MKPDSQTPITPSPQDEDSSSKLDSLQSPTNSFNAFPLTGEPMSETTQPTPAPATTATDTAPEAFNWKKTVIAALALIVIGGAVAGALMFAAPKNADQPVASNAPVAPQTQQAPKAPDAPSITTLKIFAPKNYNPSNASLLVQKSNKRGLFSYSENVKYGQGITKGSYGYMVYAADGNQFTPPANCSMPSLAPFSGKAVTIPCSPYEASGSLKAYTNDDQAYPAGITNTTVEKYMTIYAERDGSIITITSADTTYDDLYARLLDMVEIPAKDMRIEYL